MITSLLLLGWAAGGILFGRICDRIGRTRTLVFTMVTYAVGTALCAVAPNIAMLIVFRVIASLGIGGEWAAGAAMVAEVVPEKRRVEAGAFLYTAAPMGLFLATYVTWWIQGVAMPGSPGTAWRFVFLFGLLPAAVAFVLRLFVREPERWRAAAGSAPARISELFSPALRRATLSGLAMAVVALGAWWSCNAFIGVVATGPRQPRGARTAGSSPPRRSISCSNGSASRPTCSTSAACSARCSPFRWRSMPAASRCSRRCSCCRRLRSSARSACRLPPHARLYGYFFIGLSVFGVFGSFTYYLPELFPTRLRATGSGFCYNAGRVVAAAGPAAGGQHRGARQGRARRRAAHAVLGRRRAARRACCSMPWVIETRNRPLQD